MSKNSTADNEQLSLFDLISENGEDLSRLKPEALMRAIDALVNAKRRAEEREKEERALREKAEHEKQIREEQEQKDAHVREVTCMDLPLDWDNLFNSDARAQDVHYESIPDALAACLATLGRVDIEYISSVTGEDYKAVICALKGAIYQNPEAWEECFYKGWETSDEYLSGNLIRKLKSARAANKEYNGYFEENIAALEKALPPSVSAEDIYVTLGSPWVPADIIDEFMVHLFGDPLRHIYSRCDREDILSSLKTIHDETSGTWEIPQKTRYGYSARVRDVYGTNRLGALYILEKTLNMKTVAVYDKVSAPGNKSGEKRVINKEETVAAVEKQQKLIAEFQDWIWSDPNRKARLTEIFEEKYGCVKRRTFDGSILEFPGMSPSIKLYPYQKDAAARIIFTPNTLLAHDVGAGKTYVMVAAGQELKRMGLSKKNLYVVPNNIVGQWTQVFREMYPAANVLCIEPKTFKPSKRNEVLKRVRDEDFDGIIIAYSCFEQIPLSKAYYKRKLEEEQAEIKKLSETKNKATSRLKKKSEEISAKLLELALQPDGEPGAVYFDELGITRLFVDEAHNFKNVPIETQINHVLGISAGGSKKCREMLDKVRLIQRNNGGRGVVLATGTPITNSVTDAYIMQLYLQSGELGLLDLQSFDGWLGMFAEKKTEFEIDVDTSTYRLATRFSKFHNLPELTALLASVADFHAVDETAGIPQMDGYSDALVSKTPRFSDYLAEISDRADAVRRGLVPRTEDNMLKITTDGRKAALDMRLVDPACGFSYQSKVSRCAEIAADIYFSTSDKLSTQLIFCDTSTPKAGFNVYDELKRILVGLKVPEEQIAFIHDADTEARRAALFAEVRAGRKRIVIGSTFKLGMGVNIQDKLIALHHIDVPWRPADMTQREGRILRQGNENPRVKIFRYITEGSFDAYSWQLLETKQRFISDLLSGSLTARSGADIDDTVLNYAEVKALAIGNPLIKERVEIANDLARLTTLQRNLIDTRTRLGKELLELPAKQEHQRDLIAKCAEDVEYVALLEKQETPQIPEDGKAKKERAEQRRAFRDELSAALENNILQTRESEFANYRGFDIILPVNMTPVKPFVWLVRSGKYYVELGGTQTGDLIRIDNFLDTLPEHLNKLKHELNKSEEKEREIKAALASKESYSEQIEECVNRIKALDKKLGVENK